jgi:hypothetical protein
MFTFTVNDIPFPELPTQLLSAGDLVKLELRRIPPTGYISPEAVVVGLAAFPDPKSLTLNSNRLPPRPDRIHTCNTVSLSRSYLL